MVPRPSRACRQVTNEKLRGRAGSRRRRLPPGADRAERRRDAPTADRRDQRSARTCSPPPPFSTPGCTCARWRLSTVSGRRCVPGRLSEAEAGDGAMSDAQAGRILNGAQSTPRRSSRSSSGRGPGSDLRSESKNGLHCLAGGGNEETDDWDSAATDDRS